MERKKIKIKRETKVRKRKENKTEVSNIRVVHRTKSEILIKSSFTETELVTERVTEERSTTEGERCPRVFRRETMEHEVPLRPVIRRKHTSRTSKKRKMHNDVSGENTSSVREDDTTDGASEAEDDSFKNNEKSENDISASNYDISSLSDFFQNVNSFSLGTTAKRSLIQDVKESEYNGKNPDIKDSNTSSNLEINPNNINTTLRNMDSTDNSVSKVKMSKIGTIINSVFTMKSPDHNLKDKKSMVDFGDKENNVEGGKCVAVSDDMYDKGDSRLISSGDNDQNGQNGGDLDREGLERSVSCLVKYFENIKNCPSKQNNLKLSIDGDKTEDILESKTCQQEEMSEEVNTKQSNILAYDPLKSFQPNEASNSIDEIGERSTDKIKTCVCQRANKVVKSCTTSTGVQTSDFNTDSSNFCVVKCMQPPIIPRNFRNISRKPQEHMFVFQDNIKIESNKNSSKHRFVRPRLGSKLKAVSHQPNFHYEELPKEREDTVNSNANNTGGFTIGNPLDSTGGNRVVQKIADSESFVSLAKKYDASDIKNSVCYKKGDDSTEEEGDKLLEDNCGFAKKNFFRVLLVMMVLSISTFLSSFFK